MMPVRKEDAGKALELLERYYEKLNKPQDRALRTAIERVIRIFQSHLFLALLIYKSFTKPRCWMIPKHPSKKLRKHTKPYRDGKAIHRWSRLQVMQISTREL
ncbi:Disks large 3 [Desmophyllum pertusum]|uniref:Disks large 3 n=1 Tax=Desmophyllum pertusum TaxID=174260 RepID=A0A9X0A6V8_9CNID|nr:Disks large 3 [Desmophyllum pertusum]